MKAYAAVLLLLSASAFAEKWDDNNDPANLDSNYEYNFEVLSRGATLPLNKMPWASSYWPRNKGSINYRWNTPNPTGFDIHSPSKSQVFSMSQAQLAQLSPAEKFDLVRGFYDYPLSSAVARGSKKTAKDYEGICDGWTASAIQFAEPAPVTVTNPDGIVIPFGSSDVKALMSYDVSINLPNGWIGMRMGTANCTDINPGAFHVIIANQLAIKQESFAVDIDPTRETWNQPVYGFESEIIGTTKSEHSAKAYIIRTKFMYAEDDPENAEEKKNVFTWEPTVGTLRYNGAVLVYDYILEVDYSGRITGGSWLGASKTNHPDLFWLPTKKIQFTEDFKMLDKIYKPFFIE
jgi:Transglutaminase elicitor